jgi:VWFA-related protein
MVVDRDGQAADGLDSQALSVEENRVPQTGASLTRDQSPISLCVVVDVSSSVRARLDEAERIAEEIIHRAGPHDETCLVSFSRWTSVEQPFTADAAVFEQALRGLKTKSVTALWDAVVATAKEMREHARNSTRVMVVLTDGRDNASQITEEEFSRQLAALDVPVIFRIGEEEAQRDRGTMKMMTEATGGQDFYAENEKEMSAAVEKMEAAVHGRYRLTYVSNNATRDGGIRSIGIRLDEKHTTEKVILSAKQGYYAPSQP